MNYSKEDVGSLIKHLKTYYDEPKNLKYEALIDFFESRYEDGVFDIEGLTDPPKSVASAKAVRELQDLFPDAWYALKMTDDEVLLYIGNVKVQEYPIAVWRLYRQNDFYQTIL